MSVFHALRKLFGPSKGAHRLRRLSRQAGMSTAEYAVGTVAAVAFAGVLLKVLTSEKVRGALSDLVLKALS